MNPSFFVSYSKKTTVLSVANVAQLKDKFKYRDFDHFIDMWIWKNQFLREYEDFKLISDAVFNDLTNQNVKYAEIFISPSLFRKNLQTQEIVEAIASSVQTNTKIKINLIVDLVRDYGQNEMRTLHEVNEVKHLGIIGIGIGGTEHKYPPELFINIFNQAREYGFRTTAHAGEAAGPESIWKAIKDLKVDRIGHGTKAVEDPELLDYISINKIPVELCPLSNLRTGVIESFEKHPFLTYLKKGIPISINTDDPKMFGNTLAEEYEQLMITFQLTFNEVVSIIRDSIQTTWLDEKAKTKLMEEFN
jgi:adenosine deaminase